MGRLTSTQLETNLFFISNIAVPPLILRENNMGKSFDFDKLKKKALKILDKYRDIYFFSDLAVELGYSRQYLYDRGFSPDKDDDIKEALENNKKFMKRGLRAKWYKNDCPTTQVALYKLLADDDELKRLNNNIDMNVSGLTTSPFEIKIVE